MTSYQPRLWGYQLQDASPQTIAQSQHNLVVIDYEQDGAASFSEQEIKLMNAGGARKVVSYISIGEAEDYRPYWKPSWNTKPPAWLEQENPDWEGNYKVRYWNSEWQTITLDRIKAMAKAGYDGAYLDIIDAYEYFEPQRPSAAQDMIQFVAKIAAAAKAINPNFLVIPQNGEGLLEYSNYLPIIDGIGKEDLYFGLDGDGVPNPASEIAYSKELLKLAEDAGKFVLNVEYLSTPAQIHTFLKKAVVDGYSPYVGPRDLDQLMHKVPDSWGVPGTRPYGFGGPEDLAIYGIHHTLLEGNDSRNYMQGSGGDDRLESKGGNDTLSGGEGSDLLFGGAGADKLTGGAGVDAFVFQSIADSTPVQSDLIADFNSRQGDVIDLRLLDADIYEAGRQSFLFIGSAAFTSEAGLLRYAGGKLQADVNGDGVADLQIQIRGGAVTQGDLLL